MIDPQDSKFEKENIFKRIKNSFLNIPAEKAFYASVLFILAVLFVFISSIYFSKRLTTEIPKNNEKLNIAFVGNFKHFLPIYSESNIDNFVTGLLYSGLMKKDLNNQYINDLAEKISFDSTGLEINVTLKNNIKFSNNKPILTDDFIFTYNLASDILADGKNRVKYEGITFEKIDDKNFIMTFAKSFSNINNILSLGVISKSDYENENYQTLISNAKSLYSVTSGIYKVDELKKYTNDKQTLSLLTSNNQYSNPYLKYLNINSYTNNDELNIDLSSGENIDFIYNNNFINSKNKEPDLSSFSNLTYKTSKMSVIFLNSNKKEILANKKIREAIYYSIDRENLIKTLSINALPSYDILPNSNIKTNLYKNRLIEKKSSTTVNLKIADNEKDYKVASFVKDSLLTSGINVNIVKENKIDILNKVIPNRDFEMLLYSIEINSIEDLYAFWHSSQRNTPNLNITSYNSTLFDTNLLTIKTSSSSFQINKSLENILLEFYDEYPYIPLYTNLDNVIVSKKINITIPKELQEEKNLNSNIEYWYKDKEYQYKFLQKYQDQINKIYKLIH